MSRKSAAKAKRLAIWGRSLMAVCAGILVVGGAIARKFFPHVEGGGIPAGLLLILIPTWLIGIAGVVLSLAAWITYPQLVQQLKLDFPQRPDGRYFGSLPRFLACLTASLMCLGALAFLLIPRESSPIGVRLLVFYVVCSYSAFLVYLCYIYVPHRHLATTSLISLLNPAIAFFIIPVAWPILIWLSLQLEVPQKRRRRRSSKRRPS